MSTNLSQQKREKLLNNIKIMREKLNNNPELIQSLADIETELKRKKYGLIWEEHEERVDEELKTKIPVFEEIKELEIKDNSNKKMNFLIEGDNLHSLYLLEKTHRNKVDVIYIDPPYNTKNKDFIYDDKMIGDDDGFRHSKWLSFMAKRLEIAKELLNEKGVIFISIDDNEVAQLKMLCDEIFGEKNFISQLVWEKKKKGSFLSNAITNIKEYVIVYCKDYQKFKGLIGEVNYNTETYPCINANNKREIRKISKGIKSNYKDLNYKIEAGTVISDSTMNIKYLTDLIVENGVVKEDFEIEGNWRYSKDLMWDYSCKNELYITRDLYIRRIVSEPRYKNMKDLLPRVGEDENLSYAHEVNPNNLFESGWGSNEDADNEIITLFGKQRVFNYPKPTRLLKKLILSTFNKDALVLDFFAGSGTTGQAVLELNEIDGGQRNFILCTNNEKNICRDITYNRLSILRHGTPKIKPINFKLKYYKTEYIDRFNQENEEYYIVNELSKYIKELVQLEIGMDSKDNSVQILFTDEQIDEFYNNKDLINECKVLYVDTNALITDEQMELFERNNIIILYIPEYYFEEEIMEVEQW